MKGCFDSIDEMKKNAPCQGESVFPELTEGVTLQFACVSFLVSPGGWGSGHAKYLEPLLKNLENSLGSISNFLGAKKAI
jgi:hypothetical protein